MPIRLSGLLVLALAIFGVTGLACDNDEESSGREPAAEDQLNRREGDTSSGAIVPNTFMTYGGQQYRLVEIIQADFVEAGEFQEAGEATASDVQGDRTAFTREGDSISIYTFADASGSGEQPVPASWYRWDRED